MDKPTAPSAKDLEDLTKEIQSEYGPKLETAVMVAHAVINFITLAQGQFPVQAVADKLKEVFDVELKPVSDLFLQWRREAAMGSAKLVNDICNSHNNIDAATAWSIVQGSMPTKVIGDLTKAATDVRTAKP